MNGCIYCGRPAYLFDEQGNPRHPCCEIEIGQQGKKDCEACLIAESERRKVRYHPTTVAAAETLDTKIQREIEHLREIYGDSVYIKAREVKDGAVVEVFGQPLGKLDARLVKAA